MTEGHGGNRGARRWVALRAALAGLLVAPLLVGISGSPAAADHDAPDGSGTPQSGTHEAKPSPPIPMGAIGECQEFLLWQSVTEPGSDLDLITPRHRHMSFFTGVGFQINNCWLDALGGQFAMRADVGSDGQADPTADPHDAGAAPATHGEDVTQSWSSSSEFCGSFGVADGYPENANKGTLHWSSNFGGLQSGDGPWDTDWSGVDCTENWVKYVAGTAASEGGGPGEVVLWGQLANPNYANLPLCFRADLAPAALTPGIDEDVISYQGTLVLFERGGFTDSRTGHLGAANGCDGATPAPTLDYPPDGATLAFEDHVEGIPFVVNYEPDDTFWWEGPSGQWAPVVEVTDATGATTVWYWGVYEDFGDSPPLAAQLPLGEYTWTARAHVEYWRNLIYEGTTPEATPPRSFTVTGDAVPPPSTPAVVEVTPAAQTKTVGGDVTVAAHVVDQYGEPMEGVTVRFRRQLGSANTGSGTAVTDADGDATHTWTGDTQGVDVVTARASGSFSDMDGAATVVWRPPSSFEDAAAVTMTPATQTKTAGEDATVTAHVVDVDGEPVEGADVTFTRSGSHPGTDTAVTDADGNATHTWTGAGAGTDVVAAEAAGAATAVGAASVAWQPPSSEYATVVVFDPPVVEGERGSPVTVAFQAVYEDGSPFAGGTVRYGAAPAGATPAFPSSVTTDGNGKGSVEVTPTLAEPVWQVLAYADDAGEGTPGVQDAGELLGAAAVLGSPPASNSVPEAPTLVAPEDAAEFRSGDPQTFTLRATDPDGEPWTGDITVTNTDTNDTAEFSTAPAPSGQDATGAPVPQLPPGDYTWTAEAVDVHGDPGPAADPRSFTVLDNEAPQTPTLTAPADAAEFRSDDPQTFTLRATDPDGEPWTGKITVTNTATNDTTEFSTALAPSGQDATGTPTPPLEPGEYTWTATAEDARGLESDPSGSRSFTVLDNQAPTVPALVEPDHDRRFSLTDAQTFSVTSSDPDDDAYSATITVRDADTDAVVTDFPTTVAASQEDSTGAPAPPLPAGEYTWTATAEDALGNESDESEPRAFTVGNAPPVVPTLLSPRPSETFSSEEVQSFTVSATDADADAYSATVTVRDSGGSTVRSFDTAVSASGDDATGTPTSPLPPGNYSWAATAVDAHGDAGGESDPRAFSVSVNRPPEVPQLVSPKTGDVFHVEDPQVFTIQAVDPEGAPYSGTVSVTGPVSTSFETAVTASGGQSSGSPEIPLPPGEYQWEATATDAFGITGPVSVKRSFTVEGDPSPPPVEAPPPGPMTKASVDNTGAQADDWSAGTSISADGRYVVFASDASNLDPRVDGRWQDVFVRDRTTGVTELISADSLGRASNDDSWVWRDAISADGRYVTFFSYASDLVSGDSNGQPDVFVRDRVTQTTTRVSVSSSGAQGNSWSQYPAISADGRYVTFISGATNLVSGDTNGWGDVFVHDRTTGTTQRVSVSSSEAQANDGSSHVSISADGRYVAFRSWASNLVSGDTNGIPDVFVRDRSAGKTFRVSVSSSGGQSNGWSTDPAISGDGRQVAFRSDASNLVSGGTSRDDVYVRDRSANTTEIVSVSSSGVKANDWSRTVSISPDGRYVAFYSDASNLVAGDRNGASDVFLHDRTTDTTRLVSHGPDGLQANDDSTSSFPPAVSDEGLHVAFTSRASNLVAGDTNGQEDVFAYNRDLSLDCAGGSLSAVGCLSGYGFQATSNKVGLEDFYPYHPFDLGSDQALLNTHNRNLVVQGTDLEAPGQGLNLRLTRTYNSQFDQGPGPLGRGWRLGIAEGDADDLLSSVVNAALSADVGQLLEVVVTEDQFDFFDADGTRHHFIKGGLAGPGWHAPPGVNLTLTDFLVGTERRYRATRPDGVTYEFRPVTGGSYGLTSIVDRNGNTLSFSYSSGRLASVSDGQGRSFSFSWSGDYLSSVTFTGDGGTQTVNYSVNSSSGRLTSVSTGGRTVSYTYRESETDPLGSGLATATDGRGNATGFVYDSAGALLKLTDRAGEAWTVDANTTGCQPGSEEAAVAVCVTDPEGNPTTYTTSASGNLLSVHDAGDPDPNTREFFWENNRLVWESDASGRVNEYAYNENGQVILKRESGADSSTTSAFTYRNISPGVAEMTSARIGVGSEDERVWRFGLDEVGNLSSTTNPEGEVTEFAYYERGLLKTVTDPNGHSVTYGNTSASDGSYDSSGGPPSITDPLGHTKTFSYDFMGQPTSVTDRNGSTWSFGYDARGNLTSQSAPGAGTTSYGYDDNDNQTSVSPPGGATTTQSYDAADRPTAKQATVDGTLRKTTFHYDDAGRLVEVREPRTYAGMGTQNVTYTHYPNGRVESMTDEEGNTTEVTYTPDGRIQSVQAPGNHVTAYTYNRRGQVTSVFETGHTNPTTHTYNQHGERLSTRTPTGNVTRFAYDKAGRLLETSHPDGTSSKRVYDPVGNLVRATQPVNHGGAITTSYSYTPRGEIASESDPADGAHTTTYEYDPEGNQTFRRDRYSGSVERTIEQTFRGDGAVLSRKATGTDRPTHTSTYTYDGAGNMTGATAKLGSSTVSSVSVSYNGAFEPTSVSETISGISKTTTYAYQPDGLLASRTVDGKTTDYTHTLNGLEKTAVPWGGQGSFAHTYLSNGALSTTTFPNGMRATHRYDAAERLLSREVRASTSSTAGVLSAWTGIAYDDDDHRTAETVAQAQPADATVSVKSGNASYSYDVRGRLTSAKHPFDGNTATYQLDDAGNVTHETGASSEADYYYGANRLGARFFEGTQTTTQDGAKAAADVSGRSVYTYDRLGDLSSTQTDVKTTAAAETGDENVMIFDFPTTSKITTTSYDAASHTRRVKDSDGSYVDYAYDALDRMVRRVEHPADGSGDTTTLFFHGGTSQQVALETNGAGTVETRYLLNSAGYPLGQEDDEGRAYYVEDPRGNVSQLVGHDDKVKAVYGYDAFGKPRAEHTNTTGDWDSRLRFQMAPQDPKTGAYALGPRMYDPNINRFVGSDHYAGAAANMQLQLDPMTGNRYLYAGANPAGMIDDGHEPAWSPTSWNIQVRGWWRVSWQFGLKTFGRPFFNTEEWASDPANHVADVDFSYRSVTYVQITGAQEGYCESCWNDLSADIDKYQRQAYEQAVQAASAAVESAFTSYLQNQSWKWDVSWDDITNAASSLASSLVGCWQGGTNLGAQGAYWGGQIFLRFGPAASAAGSVAGGVGGTVGGCAAGAWTANRMTPGSGPWG